MLAGLLGWPQGTFASKLEFGAGEKPATVKVTREVDGGLQTLELSLPCVITADLRLNEPRYATLPNIMKATKKPIETMPLPPGVDVAPRIEVLSVAEPPALRDAVAVPVAPALAVALNERDRVGDTVREPPPVPPRSASPASLSSARSACAALADVAAEDFALLQRRVAHLRAADGVDVVHQLRGHYWVDFQSISHKHQ
jgi:hypothetical protein